MSAAPQTFSFPTTEQLGLLKLSDDERARAAREQAATNAAIARGYADRLTLGRAEAQEQAKIVLAAARAETITAAHAEGLAQVQQAAAGLAAALAEFERERAALAAECESFCVRVSLAIVARLVEAAPVRAEFVTRAVATALKALAPAAPIAVFLNPADRKLAAKALTDLPLKDDETICSGHARIEAGRFLVEAGIEQAFEQIRAAVIDVKKNPKRAATARSQSR